MKSLSMPLDKYYQIVKPTYVYLKVVPHKSNRNQNTSNLAKAICGMFKTINQRIEKIEHKYIYHTDWKCSYMIDINKTDANDICFYFIVPNHYKNLAKEKIREVWNKSYIEEIDNIEPFKKDAIKYQLNYKFEDALSLKIDKSSNEPLNSILNVFDIMENGDRVSILYNFKYYGPYMWENNYKNSIEKWENHKSLEKQRGTGYFVKAIANVVVDILDMILGVFTDLFGGAKANTKQDLSLVESLADVINGNRKNLSNATLRKGNKNVLKTQIVIMSDSKNANRANINALSVCNAYKVLDEDNSLVYKKIKEPLEIEDKAFKGVDTNLISVDECQNLLQAPGRELLNQFKIDHIKVIENPVPKELSTGIAYLGEVKYKENIYKSYLEDTYDKGSLPLVQVGAQGSGKSTFMANYYRFVNKRKEGGVVIDFIKNCEMSDEVISYLPKEDMIILDYTKEECLQSFAFNEFEITENMDTFTKLSLANLQAQQVLVFIDSINQEQPLQARMGKYLSAASNVVFASGETSLKEVIKCLENHKVRYSYINKLNEREKQLLEDEINDLSEIDEYSKPKDNSKPEVIGTKESKIEGILDRVSVLRRDFKLKYMYNKNSINNINFAKELETGKTIIIRMPQDSVKKHAKNVIVTFLLSKIWVATEIRGRWNKKPKPTHICIDEVFQCKTAMRMLDTDDILPQTRKFGCKFMFSCQYTEQIQILLDTLIGAGASFMFLCGTSEKDFKLFENKLDNFEYEDLKYMENHSSMNLIYYSGGYASFISKLPPPIKNKTSDILPTVIKI
ncbi:hypothetical protein [Clostridium ihumii]|uniref:hypothetical protein n=1 Tax=Clostridium ihumii TaxID=1470356 RepID=UPI000685581D|nr:hypothetical protein [Clostridium ihumii]